MSQSRRQRRQLEKALGLKKKSSNFFSKEETDLRKRRRKAGEEIHRQNLERMRNNPKQEDDSPLPNAETPPIQENISLGKADIKDSGPSGSEVVL